MEYIAVRVMTCSQPKCITPKIRGHKLRSGVYWKEALKQNG